MRRPRRAASRMRSKSPESETETVGGQQVGGVGLDVQPERADGVALVGWSVRAGTLAVVDDPRRRALLLGEP